MGFPLNSESFSLRSGDFRLRWKGYQEGRSEIEKLNKPPPREREDADGIGRRSKVKPNPAETS